MVASKFRLVPPDIAHMASNAQPCGERLRFPDDERDAECSLQVGDHVRGDWHLNAENTRRWRKVGRDVEAMAKPGSPVLR